MQKMPKEWKVLAIGNSFSADTLEHLANIALAMGAEKVKVANLYIGGCSIRKHYRLATENLAEYEYHVNNGEGWSMTLGHGIADEVKSENWDWISIQHGTGDGSYYTREEYYENLPALVKFVKDNAWSGAKIAFNMTWVGEMDFDHHEIRSFEGDQLEMYRQIAALTGSVVAGVEGIEKISPTGTAVQNARSLTSQLLTRDGYHLSWDTGRYIAGLTFFKTLTGLDISNISWAPEGTDEQAKAIAIASVDAALETPYAVTQFER